MNSLSMAIYFRHDITYGLYQENKGIVYPSDENFSDSGNWEKSFSSQLNIIKHFFIDRNFYFNLVIRRLKSFQKINKFARQSVA